MMKFRDNINMINKIILKAKKQGVYECCVLGISLNYKLITYYQNINYYIFYIPYENNEGGFYHIKWRKDEEIFNKMNI